ncbi:MAG: hypothetical protein ACXVBK_11300, partial [Flavisolibacter sp.]
MAKRKVHQTNGRKVIKIQNQTTRSASETPRGRIDNARMQIEIQNQRTVSAGETRGEENREIPLASCIVFDVS